jgi:hypothetical protein
MSAANPLLKDDSMPQPRPHEPSMEEILASIRRTIADDQALSESHGPRGEALRADQNGGAFEPASHAVAGRAFVSNATDGSVRAAFNALRSSGSRAANNSGLDRAPQSNLPYGICRGAVSCALGRASGLSGA